MKAYVKEYLPRVIMTASALAIVLGIVQIMRVGARAAADGLGLTSGGSAIAPETERAMTIDKTYDLSLMVPAELALNVGGLPVRSTIITIDAPYEIALKMGEADARAAGWERMNAPLVYTFSLELKGVYVYRRPDGVIIRRAYEALANDMTRREDFEIPVNYLGEITSELDYLGIAALRGRYIREKLPALIRDLVIGDPVFTHLIRRGTGASLTIVSAATWDEASLLASIRGAAYRAGWTYEERLGRGWRKDNLTAIVDFSRTEDGKGTMMSWRFADDDVEILKQERKIDEE